MNNIILLSFFFIILIILNLVIITLIKKQIDNQKKIIRILSAPKDGQESKKIEKKGPLPSDELEKIKAEYMKSGGYRPNG